MNGLARVLGPVRERWERVDPGSVWAGAAVVVVAWGLIALNRIGGLAFDAPRALIRLTLRGVWGWLGLAVTIWAIAVRLSGARRRIGWRDLRSLQLSLAVVGIAHTPIIVLAVVVFLAAGAFEVLGPGLVVAVVVLAVVVPLALVTGVQHVFGFDLGHAAVVVAGPYAVWLAVVARVALDQIRHLL